MKQSKIFRTAITTICATWREILENISSSGRAGSGHVVDLSASGGGKRCLICHGLKKAHLKGDKNCRDQNNIVFEIYAKIIYS
jgi:hypothetical protein